MLVACLADEWYIWRCEFGCDKSQHNRIIFGWFAKWLGFCKGGSNSLLADVAKRRYFGDKYHGDWIGNRVWFGKIICKNSIRTIVFNHQPLVAKVRFRLPTSAVLLGNRQ